MRTKLAFLLLLLSVPANCWSQTGLAGGWSAYRSGEYAAAARLFAQAANHAAARVEARIGESLALQEMGRYAACRELLHTALREHPAAPLAHRLSELEWFVGNQAEALVQAENALRLDPDFLPSRLLHAEINWQRGERRESRRAFASLLDYYRTATTLAAADLVMVARACLPLERFHDANRLFAEAVQRQPEDWRWYLPWGELFLHKHNVADARGIFADALKQNPNCVPALLGLARVQAHADLSQAVATAERALSLNSASPAVRTVLAELLLAGNAEDAAAAQLEQVLASFPNHLPALALHAVLADRHRQSAEVDQIAAQAAVINPYDASLFVQLGDDAARRYLFEESVAYYRRALAVDAENWQATAGLGLSLSRLGHETEAKTHLETAFAHDPFNVMVGNLLNLFDEFARYDTVRSAHFLLRMHPADKAVIGRAAAELCEAAYRDMVPRYGNPTLTRPIKVEIFPHHDDFAVRCFGLPGAEVFLGICFGPLIAMDSPRARERAAFNWQETLWHEIAHVVHLQLTANRIPRWLAEGLSVYESTRARSEWRMNMEVAMIRALRQGDLPALRELDQGFTRRPDQVSLVYFQAAQIVEYITQHHGFDKVLALLRHFRQGRSTEEALPPVFGQSTDDFDRDFRVFLHERFKPQMVKVDAPGHLPAAGSSRDQDKLRQLAEREPDNLFAVLAHGRDLASRGQFAEAEKYLRRAKALLPEYVQEGNAYRALAELYWQQGRHQDAVAELEWLTAHNGRALAEALLLADWQLVRQDTAAAVRSLERALAIHPHDGQQWRRLGELRLALRLARPAVEALHTALALQPADRAGVHCKLAEAYLLEGQRAQAKKQALRALELAPMYERAQEILLRTVE